MKKRGRPIGSGSPPVDGLGGRVLQLRVQAGLSQEALGREAARVLYPSGRWGFSKSQICLLEKGHVNPSMLLLIGLAKALKTSADFLLFGEMNGNGTAAR